MSASNTSTEPLFPTSYPEYVYNFAYGSNMHKNILSGRRKIHPLESIPGVLEGWQLTFDLRGVPGVEPCFGNIKQNPDSEIHGILHKMTERDFKRLLATEGGSGVDANGYIPHKVNVHAYDGRMIEAYALVARQTSPYVLREHALPSTRYMKLLRDGAIHHKIHPLYVEYLQSLPSTDRSKPIMILVVIELVVLGVVLSPIWIPGVLYYVFTNRKAHARSFAFTLMMVNLWRIYRLSGALRAIQPYYSAPFPLGSTDFKENTKTFRDQVQSDEQTLQTGASDVSSQRDSSSTLPTTNKQSIDDPCGPITSVREHDE